MVETNGDVADGIFTPDVLFIYPIYLHVVLFAISLTLYTQKESFNKVREGIIKKRKAKFER